MVDAFAEGAKEAGHEVEILHVGKPVKASKAALLLSSASPNPYEGAIATFNAAGDENKSEAKMAEIKAFAKAPKWHFWVKPENRRK